MLVFIGKLFVMNDIMYMYMILFSTQGSFLDVLPYMYIYIYIFIIQQIVTLSKYGHDALDICHP